MFERYLVVDTCLGSLDAKRHGIEYGRRKAPVLIVACQKLERVRSLSFLECPDADICEMTSLDKGR